MKHPEVEWFELFMDALMAPLPLEGDEDTTTEPVVVTCGLDCECPDGHCAYEGR